LSRPSDTSRLLSYAGSVILTTGISDNILGMLCRTHQFYLIYFSYPRCVYILGHVKLDCQHLTLSWPQRDQNLNVLAIYAYSTPL
jgi:hypothetical protein